jgi:hypothetical protein
MTNILKDNDKKLSLKRVTGIIAFAVAIYAGYATNEAMMNSFLMFTSAALGLSVAEKFKS